MIEQKHGKQRGLAKGPIGRYKQIIDSRHPNRSVKETTKAQPPKNPHTPPMPNGEVFVCKFTSLTIFNITLKIFRNKRL